MLLERRDDMHDAHVQVLGEINALKEELAKKIGIVPLHHLGHHYIHARTDYLDKLHRLAEHIKVQLAYQEYCRHLGIRRYSRRFLCTSPMSHHHRMYPCSSARSQQE